MKIKVNEDYKEMINTFQEHMGNTDWYDVRTEFLTKGLTFHKGTQGLYAKFKWRFDIIEYCEYHDLEIPTQKDFDDLLEYYKQCDIEFYIEEIKSLLDTFKDDNDDCYLEDVEQCIKYIRDRK